MDQKSPEATEPWRRATAWKRALAIALLPVIAVAAILIGIPFAIFDCFRRAAMGSEHSTDSSGEIIALLPFIVLAVILVGIPFAILDCFHGAAAELGHSTRDSEERIYGTG